MNDAINAVRQELADAGLPPLSSTAVEPHPLDSPSYLPSPRLFEARRLALACIGQLKSLLQLPFQQVVEQTFGSYHSACIDVFVQTGIVDYMASMPNISAGTHVNEIGSHVDLDSRKLTTVLRYLSGHGWVRETAEAVFALNRQGLELVAGRNGWTYAVTPMEPTDRLPAGQQYKSVALSVARSAPRLLASYADGIQVVGECYALGVLADYPWNALPATQTLVDCGGGQGALTIALAKNWPSRKFIIQDVDDVVQRARAQRAGAGPRRARKRTHRDGGA
ncbi:hypothetical protein A0H81_12112 [Grifola frondosa]|uniref:O-methyltransferase C-terminal domain-containing protein n=1 Tax=Grifola frondosa TaxID=5627 RepID=A0A1C7LSB7_GRIFR|nr:hypothetical protein A0H81_12112 [Grifola frondosa]